MEQIIALGIAFIAYLRSRLEAEGTDREEIEQKIQEMVDRSRSDQHDWSEAKDEHWAIVMGGEPSVAAPGGE